MSGMQCPVCEVPLSISSREGVEIDFCPQCRGVWLDRGELDKIIERAGTAMAPPREPEPARRSESRYGDDDRYRDDRPRDDRYRGDDDRYRTKKKRGGFLEDLFDFD